MMYLLGYSIDNLSLMALTISTGFVVDDAIVVIENISRYLEQGLSARDSAFRGAREVGFTVLSMSTSLIAVFIPILLMQGIVGRIFREFAVTLSLAVVFSMIISLTTTPAMCAKFLKAQKDRKRGWIARACDQGSRRFCDGYAYTLRWVLRHQPWVLGIALGTVGLAVYLYIVIPKGFFPQQDTGTLNGNLRADQSISFQAMVQKLRTTMSIVQQDPAVQDVVGYTGGGGYGATNTANIFVGLKPLKERHDKSDRVIARLRAKLAVVTGARLYLQAVQDIRAGARQSNSQYQYTILADSLQDLRTWTPKITDALKNVPELADVNSDQQDKGLTVALKIDRATAARLGINLSNIDNTLYDAFGQRQVSTIYNDMNQYHVVMEVDPSFWQNPETLREVWVSTTGGALSGTQTTAAGFGSFSSSTSAATNSSSTTGTNTNVATISSAPAGSSTSSNTIAGTTTAATGTVAASANSSSLASAQTATAAQNLALNQLTNSARGGASTGASVSTSAETMVPLAGISEYGPGTTPLAINHQGPFVATTFSFNLPEGVSLGTAINVIGNTMQTLHVPISVHGSFAGTAQIFQQSLSSEPVLIAAAIVAVYIVLGVLYESYVHPITILSTLPSAGVGAVLALLIFGTEFSLIALIGVILLIGIVKKNAIMMIDVALETERTQKVDARTAIYEACLLRFRPIMMTTMAALLGAIPLAVTTGSGAEMRQPLGISIVGGLLVSQVLTLYTTPVVYLYLDRLRVWASTRTRRGVRAYEGPREQYS
jgi:multidrug efflux pump